MPFYAANELRSADGSRHIYVRDVDTAGLPPNPSHHDILIELGDGALAVYDEPTDTWEEVVGTSVLL